RMATASVAEIAEPPPVTTHEPPNHPRVPVWYSQIMEASSPVVEVTVPTLVNPLLAATLDQSSCFQPARMPTWVVDGTDRAVHGRFWAAMKLEPADAVLTVEMSWSVPRQAEIWARV